MSRPRTALVAARWQLLGAALALLALLLGAPAAWLQGKAVLAQWLLQRSFDHATAATAAPLPWPGADTHPVARLSVPRLAIDQIVLAGDSGRSLAFGPGWAEASAAPGSSGTTVLSGHRDTHFAFLRALQAGDRVLVATPRGEETFVVARREVVDSRSTRLRLGGEARRLVLVTCWPFDTAQAGGPLRYVVTAEPAVASTLL